MEDEEGEKNFLSAFLLLFSFFCCVRCFFSQRLPGAGRLDVNGVLWGVVGVETLGRSINFCPDP